MFIDKLNAVLKELAAKYPGTVFHVDLTGTLQTRDEWANELHPLNEGFAKLADKLNDSLQKNIP